MNFSGTLHIHGFRILLGITTALAIAVLCEPLLGGWWGYQLLMLAGLLALIFLLLRMEVSKQMSSERAAKRALDTLCQLDDQDLANPPANEILPELSAENPWRTVFSRVRDRLVESCQRADEAEHAWTSCEVRLRRTENERARVGEILDRVADSIMVVNHYDEIIWWNEPARVLLGLPSSNNTLPKLQSTVRSKTLIDLLVDTRRRKIGSHRSGEIELTDQGGQQRWFRAVCRAQGDSTAEPNSQHSALAVLTDISVEKVIQKRHAEFVAAAAHEMKTPLSSIRAYVELLQDGEVDQEETKDEFFDVIQSQAERLQRLIENLLNLARIEAGVVKVEKQQLSLNEVLEQAFNVIHPTAEQKPVEFVRDLSPMYLGVLADRDMILQTAINLLSNAVKYTPAKGKVTLKSRIDENAAIFEVEDTGVGLSPEDCHKIFEKFYRVKKDQQMAAGTGLGLPLAKHIVEDVHGGTVTVFSQLGAGSTFRVTLPVVGRG